MGSIVGAVLLPVVILITADDRDIVLAAVLFFGVLGGLIGGAVLGGLIGLLLRWIVNARQPPSG
jgi:hypothetical protein